MRLSRYFLPLLKETPKEAEIVSHQLMLRAGMIKQQAAGSYSWLPLGFKVLNKIVRIIEEEQNRSGAIQLLMPTVQSADLWRESGRYDAYGKEMLRIEDRHERDMLFGPTNEEMITDIFRTYVKSYKDLPLNLYHIQWKFRDEVRPRFGTMRSREFLMKDAYSFDLDEAGAVRAFQRMFVAYLRTFHRMGLVGIPMRADTGPIGGDMSYEFHVLADTGESAVFLDKRPDRQADSADRHRFPRRPRADLQGLDLALCGDRRNDRRGHLQGRRPRGPPAQRARHRGRPHLLFRHQVLGADEGHGHRPRRPGTCPSRWAATASARRASCPRSSKPRTTRTASSGRSASRPSRPC